MDMNDLVIISVDDHISEPPDMFDKHLSGTDLETAPKLRTTDKGTNYWEYYGMRMPAVGLNAVVGRVPEEYGVEPTAFEQLRPGVYDVDKRVEDMNVNGVAASLNFGSCVGFDGSVFHKVEDKASAVKHLRAYNDWHVDEWCGKHPGRFIPCGLLPTWDMDATVAEVKRLADKGVTAVSINENPTTQKLPSIHNEYWEPLWKAVANEDMAMCLHIGAGNPAPHASMETPIEAWISTMPISIVVGAADWLNLEALERYPLKIALSEGGIGWVPYFLERANFSHARHKAWTHSRFKDTQPSDVFKKHFRASVARYGQPREKRSVRGEPAGYELGEEPHALGLACLPLGEKPERSIHVQVGARHSYQQGVGISDEAWQRRDPEPLPYGDDLRRGVRGPERNPRGANLTLAGPIRNAMLLMTIHRMGSGAPARHAASRSRDM
jgi:predicted TIM-barrel fold metal-dependent hydrolase